MQTIHAEPIDSFRQGRWRLMRATLAGSTPATTKGGTIEAPFAAGDVLLADSADDVVVPPVSRIGATDLAERILDGDSRAATDPHALLVLALAIAGFGFAEAPPTEPKAEAREAVAE